ncbi:MAG: hypothetical protein IJO45_03175 [Oscillospiraceae bacterium]|nr:hypothetical protein [Oscillospiraceae bacterium]
MKVNTAELNRQAAQLRSAARRMGDIQESVLRITRVLSQQSVGEKFRQPLNAAARSIVSRETELMRMGAALNQIADLYEQTELRIVDEAEHATVRYPHLIVGEIHVPTIVGPGGQFGPVSGLDELTGMIDWTPWDP